MASVSAADVRDALNLAPADIADSKVIRMIKRAEVMPELETDKEINYNKLRHSATAGIHENSKLDGYDTHNLSVSPYHSIEIIFGAY